MSGFHMNQFPVSKTALKNVYQQPQLKTYGDLRRLTQAGTRGFLENNTTSGAASKKA